MSQPIAGKPWSISWEVSGAVTASTAPVLWIDGVSSGASVTWTTSVAGVVTATVTLSGVNAGQTVQFRGGSVTVGGTAYELASSVRTVQTDQHIVAGVSQIATPADLDIRLAAGDAARVVLGKAIFLGGKFRIPTARGSGPSVDEIALDDASDLTPASVAYAYVQPWESGRPSTEGMTDHELVVLGALNTHGVSTHSAADVWAVSTRSLTTFGTLVSDVWSHATRILTAGTNIVLAKGTGITGFNDLSEASVRNAIGLDTNNLDVQLAALSASLDTLTTNVPGVLNVTNINNSASRFLGMIELDGPVYVLTVNALKNAPAGEGGGGGGTATIENQDKLLKITQAS